MQKLMRFAHWSVGPLLVMVAAAALTGCASSQSTTSSTAPATPAPAAAPAASAAPAAAPASAKGAIRIDAGATATFTDSQGNVWMADKGFNGGDTVERASDLKIANTSDPGLYRTEHYGMAGFSYDVPNGKYTVKLHFAETYEEVTGPGQRVFTMNVNGHELKDFDAVAKAGGPMKAYIETVNVEVTNGKIEITFTSNVQNPEINGIEIIPAM